MNTIYFYEFVNRLERVLSAAYEAKYSLGALERQISYCTYFQNIEEGAGFELVTTENKLMKEIFPEITIILDNVPVHNQCLWVAESYLHIQENTGLTFEAIFLYIPIEMMYQYFSIYHEMDFSQIVDEFIKLFKNKSVLSALSKKYGFSMREVAKATNISYETLLSLKQRKRDISKANYEMVYKISKFFHVRASTLAELNNNNF